MPAPKTRRTRLVEALESRLQTIAVDAGYLTAIGSRVFVCRPTKPQESELPALNLWDLKRTSKAITSGAAEHQLEIDILIMTAGVGGREAAETIRQYIADVWKAIGVDDSFGGLCHWTEIKEDEYEVDAETGTLTGTVKISITMHYRGLVFDDISDE